MDQSNISSERIFSMDNTSLTQFNLSTNQRSQNLEYSLALEGLTWTHNIIKILFWPPLFCFGILSNLITLVYMPSQVVAVGKSAKQYYIIIAVFDLCFLLSYGIVNIFDHISHG